MTVINPPLTGTAVLLVLLGSIVVVNASCEDNESNAAPLPERVAPAPSTQRAGQPMQYRGLAIQVQSGYRPIERFVPLLEEVRELGANTVLLSVPGFMEHAESQQIFIEARKTPSREEFKEIVRSAKGMDLDVILMPIILLAKPRGSEWRGVIDPPDWNEWWRQYREFIVYFCDIAREGGADGLIVGSELVSTEKYTDRWLEIIETAREHFYGGLLGYSANWDHYKPVKFWHALDFVGMTSYYTLAEEENPELREILSRWEPVKAEVLRWQAEIGKPIIFTEVGWCSQEGAATAPWNYYQNQKATPAGMEEQRRLYEAFLRVWNGTPGVIGAIWWEWSEEPGGPSDFGYTPRGKPAEQVLREWFRAAEKQAPSTTTQPARP